MQSYLARGEYTEAVLWIPETDGFMEEDAGRSFRDTILEIANAEIPLRRFVSFDEIYGNPAVVLTSAASVPALEEVFAEELE